MLDVNTERYYTLLYQHFTKVIEKMKNLTSMNFLSEIYDRKESEEGRKLIQNKCVSSQKHRMKKEEGATVAATYLLSIQRAASFLSFRPDRQRSSMEGPKQWETPINYLKCPTFDANRRRFSDFN